MHKEEQTAGVPYGGDKQALEKDSPGREESCRRWDRNQDGAG